MGCNLCDDCSECTVGGSIGCGEWDPDEHRDSSDSDYYEYYWGHGDEYDDDEEYEDDDEEYDEDEIDCGRGSHCANCGAIVLVRWNYCMACGAPISKKFCVNCGERVAEGWEYCPQCGSSIPSVIRISVFEDEDEDVDDDEYDENIPF